MIWGARPLFYCSQNVKANKVDLIIKEYPSICLGTEVSYQVIARKWRPQAFSDVVGQAHITQTLGNALKNDRLPHALLFTGPRGTGKTSSARILAKSLRCPNSVDFVPCNHCDSCSEIANGNSVDVIEIDGASNNGVDAIRELREGVAFMPSTGKYKIYIIDEVHMLSTSAFNALLKTLEEPPAHVIFIMCTTEVHKIPQTILSRCQRFDFRRISTKQITERLSLICQNDGISAHQDALWIIARQGDGSMRDSQSLLDQVVTFANGELTREKVVEILGLTDHMLLFDTLAAIIHRDTKAIVKIIEKTATSGFEPQLFAQNLLETIRNLLMVKIAADDISSILEMPDSELAVLQQLGLQTSEEELHLLFDMALKSANDIQKAQDPRLVLEVVMLRMVSAPRLIDIHTLLNQFKNQSHNVQSLSTPQAPHTAPAKTSYSAQAPLTQSSQKIQEAQHVREIPSGLEAMKASLDKMSGKKNSIAQNNSPQHPTDKPQQDILLSELLQVSSSEKWLMFVDRLRQADALFAAKIENLLFVQETDNCIRLGVPAKLVFLKEQMADSQVRKKLQGFIDSYWGSGYSFDVTNSREQVVGESAQSLEQKKIQLAEDDLREKIEQHPKVVAAMKAFNGKIRSITTIGKGS